MEQSPKINVKHDMDNSAYPIQINVEGILQQNLTLEIASKLIKQLQGAVLDHYIDRNGV